MPLLAAVLRDAPSGRSSGRGLSLVRRPNCGDAHGANDTDRHLGAHRLHVETIALDRAHLRMRLVPRHAGEDHRRANNSDGQDRWPDNSRHGVEPLMCPPGLAGCLFVRLIGACPRFFAVTAVTKRRFVHRRKTPLKLHAFLADLANLRQGLPLLCTCFELGHRRDG
jgi:hypothetical protein